MIKERKERNLLRGPLEIELNTKDYSRMFSRKGLRFTDISLYSSFTFIPTAATELFKTLKSLVRNDYPLSDTLSVDIGCCIGAITEHLLRHTKRVIAIEYEPLQTDITWTNLSVMGSNLDHLELFTGDASKISETPQPFLRFDGVKHSESIMDIRGSNFYYIGTPFIDLQFGDMTVEALVRRVLGFNQPDIIVIQLPGYMYKKNARHEHFFRKELRILEKEVIHAGYLVANIYDLKSDSERIFNRHLIFLKQNIVGGSVLKTVVNGKIPDIRITHPVNQIWRKYYSRSCYIDGYVNKTSVYVLGKTVKNNTVVDEQFVLDLPTSDKFILTGAQELPDSFQRCKLYFDRFGDKKIRGIQIV